MCREQVRQGEHNFIQARHFSGRGKPLLPQAGDGGHTAESNKTTRRRRCGHVRPCGLLKVLDFEQKGKLYGI